MEWTGEKLIMSLCMVKLVVLRMINEWLASSKIGRGVRQGYLIYVALFNIYAEAKMKKAFDGMDEGNMESK